MAHTELDRYRYSEGPYLREDIFINVTATAAETVKTTLSGIGTAIVVRAAGQSTAATTSGKTVSFTSAATGNHLISVFGPSTNDFAGATTEDFRYVGLEGWYKHEVFAGSITASGTYNSKLQNIAAITYREPGAATPGASFSRSGKTITAASAGTAQWVVRAFEGNKLVSDAVNNNDGTTTALIRFPTVVKGPVKKEYIFLANADTTALTFDTSMADPKYAFWHPAAGLVGGTAGTATALVTGSAAPSISGRTVTIDPPTNTTDVCVEIWGF